MIEGLKAFYHFLTVFLDVMKVAVSLSASFNKRRISVPFKFPLRGDGDFVMFRHKLMAQVGY